MNIQQEALYHFLQNKDIKYAYFYDKDYKLICEKSLAYKKKNKELPSIKFLFNNCSKLSSDKEQIDRLEDLLYVMEKYKPELESMTEVNELLLSNYKTENNKDLIKKMATSLTENNEDNIIALSKRINDISKIELTKEAFSDNDVKKDIKKGSIKADLIPSGFFPNAHPSLSQIARGSVISIIGDTGFGKSVMTVGATLNQYLAGYDTVYISYEMPKRAILARMLSNISSVPIAEINDESYSTDEAELRIQAGKAVLEYEIDFDKAFNRVLKGRDFSDCKVRTNYLKIIAIASSDNGEDIDELPDNESILNMLEERKPDFLTIDLISEVKIKKSLGNYETDLSEFTRELNRLALKNNSVVIVVSQPSSSSVGGLIFPKYAKSIRSSSSSNILIASTQEMMKEKASAIIVEKCRHNVRGVVEFVQNEFEYMRFNLIEEATRMTMEEFFIELAKDFKKKGNKE